MYIVVIWLVYVSPLYLYTFLMDSGVFSRFWLIWVKLPWIFVYKSLCRHVFVLILCKIPRSGIAGLYVCLTLKENTKLLSKIISFCIFPPASYEVSSCSTSSTLCIMGFLLIFFLKFTHSNGCVVVPHCGFNLHSLAD